MPDQSIKELKLTIKQQVKSHIPFRIKFPELETGSAKLVYNRILPKPFLC